MDTTLAQHIFGFRYNDSRHVQSAQVAGVLEKNN